MAMMGRRPPVARSLSRIAAVASNHPDLERLSAPYDVPFHHFPVTADSRAAQEQQRIEEVW